MRPQTPSRGLGQRGTLEYCSAGIFSFSFVFRETCYFSTRLFTSRRSRPGVLGKIQAPSNGFCAIGGKAVLPPIPPIDLLSVNCLPPIPEGIGTFLAISDKNLGKSYTHECLDIYRLRFEPSSGECDRSPQPPDFYQTPPGGRCAPSRQLYQLQLIPSVCQRAPAEAASDRRTASRKALRIHLTKVCCRPQCKFPWSAYMPAFGQTTQPQK